MEEKIKDLLKEAKEIRNEYDDAEFFIFFADDAARFLDEFISAFEK